MEILYKAKRLDNNEFAEGFIITSDEHMFIFNPSGVKPDGYDYIKRGGAVLGFIIEVNPKTKCMCTGLKARNKKTDESELIFENDIFRTVEETDSGDIVKYNVVMYIKQLAAFYLIPIEHYKTLRDNDVSNEPEFSWLFDDAMLSDFSNDVVLTKVGNLFNNKSRKYE